MNKLFKLVYINLLSLFDINKIIIAREDGVKSNLEKRLIIVGIVGIVYSYLIYLVFTTIKLENNYLILCVGFTLSTLLCLGSNLFNIESSLFRSDDNEILFSLPVSRQQIIFSKLFVIYLRNILMVILVMFPCMLAYYKNVLNISDTLCLMYVLVSMVIPFIPMVLSSVIAYFNDYYKTKTNNNMKYKLCKIFIILVVALCIFLLFRSISIKGIEQGILVVLERINYIYPLINIFYLMLEKESYIGFIVLLLIPGLIMYIYSLVISKNYARICSMLKGVKTNNKFIYRKKNNLHKVGGMIRKEFTNLFSNKVYFTNSFNIPIMFTILLFVVFNFVDLRKFYEMENFEFYVNAYLPMILCTIISLGCSTICSMSLEKGNMQILRTMPISINKVLLSKWLVNIIVNTIIILINLVMIVIYLDLKKMTILFSFLIPFTGCLFVSMTSLLLDYRFIEKNETIDNAIIKERLLGMVPSFISLLILIVSIMFPMNKNYLYLLGAYVVIFILFIGGEWIYIFINKKKLLRGLFN